MKHTYRNIVRDDSSNDITLKEGDYEFVWHYKGVGVVEFRYLGKVLGTRILEPDFKAPLMRETERFLLFIQGYLAE